MLSRAPGSHPRARWFWQVLLANIFCSEAYHQNLFTLSQLDKREWVLGLGGGGTRHLLGSGGDDTRARHHGHGCRGRMHCGERPEPPGPLPALLEPRGPSPHGAAAFRAPP